MTVHTPGTKPFDPIELASRDEIAALQLARLKWTLRHAYDNVAHYRKRLRRARACIPSDFRSLADLAQVPVHHQGRPARQLSVRHVRGAARTGRAHPRLVAAPPASRPWSATRKSDIDTWAELMARSIRAAGGRPGDIVHIAYGYGLFTGGLGAHYGAERLGCTVVPMSRRPDRAAGAADPRLQARHHHGDAVLHAGASSTNSTRQGLDPRACSLRIGIFGAEPWTECDARARSRRASTCDAVDIYGLSEVMGPGVARNASRPRTGCTSGKIISIRRSSIPRPATVLPDGEQGELVFTSLTKEALPVIRYRTRDLTRLLPRHGAHACGGWSRITGRTDDMLIIRGVNVFPTQIEELILKERMLSPHYVLEVYRRDHLDTLDVVVEARPELGGA